MFNNYFHNFSLNMEDDSSNMSNTEFNLHLIIKTWNNESNGIYNYKSDKFSQVNDESSEGHYYLINHRNNILKKDRQSHIDTDCEILFRTRRSKKNKNQFEIINPVSKCMKRNEFNINNLNNNAWYVTKPETDFFENDNEDYELNENDIIKFGRKKYQIIKKNINISQEEVISNNPNNYNISQLNKKKGEIFDINIEQNQYKITENENNKNESKNEDEKNFSNNQKKNNKENINDVNDINENKENKNLNNELDKTDYRNNEDFKKSEDSQKKNIFDENDNQIETDEEERENFYNDNNQNIEMEFDDNEKCRICFDIKSTKENPKLCICACKDYIHFECLKKYLTTKIEIHENDKFTVKTYVCQRFNCEVCLTPYPLRFRIKEYNKIYQLIDYNLPSELDYIVLESLDYIKEHMNLKIVHVVQLVDEKISIGRNFINDIIDTDISVSRNHAVLKYNKENGKLIVENRSEKFGTLILIKGNIKMKEKKIGFQVGKTYITANIIKRIGNECYYRPDIYNTINDDTTTTTKMNKILT